MRLGHVVMFIKKVAATLGVSGKSVSAGHSYNVIPAGNIQVSVNGDGAQSIALATGTLTETVAADIQAKVRALTANNPANQAAISSFTASGTPFADMYAWFGSVVNGQTGRINLATGVVSATYTHGNYIDGMCDDGQFIYAAVRTLGIAKMNRTTGALISYLTSAGTSGLFNLCFDGSHLWVTTTGTNLYKINPYTDTLVGTFVVGSYGSGICYDGANIWVAGYFSNIITKLRASDGFVLATAAVTRPYKIIFDGAHIWSANPNSSSTTKVRASDGVVIGSYGVGAYSAFLATDGVNIWVSNANANTITKLVAATGAFVGTYSDYNSPYFLFACNGYVWTFSSGNHSLSKRNMSDGSIVAIYPIGTARNLQDGCVTSSVYTLASGTTGPSSSVVVTNAVANNVANILALGVPNKGTETGGV